MAEAAPVFNIQRFIDKLKCMLDRTRITWSAYDNVNHFVFKKLKSIDPAFVIPTTHSNRWHPVDDSSSSDSAVSETDSDDDRMSSEEITKWLDSLMEHIRSILNTLPIEERTDFLDNLAVGLQLSVKKRTRLGILL